MSVLTIDTECLLNLLCQIKSGSMRSDIAGLVAAMTENELDIAGMVAAMTENELDALG